MSMQDPIADMLTRIRNAQQARHEYVTMNASRLKTEIARVLKEEGYIEDFHSEEMENQNDLLTLKLKYYQGEPVIERISRVSKPGLRVYKPYKELTAVRGFGIRILTTPKGVMSHIAAKEHKVGGEVICEVA